MLLTGCTDSSISGSVGCTACTYASSSITCTTCASGYVEDSGTCYSKFTFFLREGVLFVERLLPDTSRHFTFLLPHPISPYYYSPFTQAALNQGALLHSSTHTHQGQYCTYSCPVLPPGDLYSHHSHSSSSTQPTRGSTVHIVAQRCHLVTYTHTILTV